MSRYDRKLDQVEKKKKKKKKLKEKKKTELDISFCRLVIRGSVNGGGEELTKGILV
jgi:hypothetical protein